MCLVIFSNRGTKVTLIYDVARQGLKFSVLALKVLKTGLCKKPSSITPGEQPGGDQREKDVFFPLPDGNSSAFSYL